jgi:sugar O-acyltransferase (sialic acid O-acetyltransferase NeuD family)
MTARAPIAIVGAGGLARETAAAIDAINVRDPSWELLGFLDDDETLHGSARDGVPILGPVAMVAEMESAFVIVCTARTGDYFSRRRLVEAMHLPAERFAIIVHPAASLARSVEVGPGSVVLAGVVGTVSVRMGSHVAVMPHTVLTHDDVVADYVTLAAGVRAGGGVRIDQGAYIGAGALIREGLTIGAWSLVGMGAVVVREVPAREVWAGVPARFLRSVREPVHFPT